MLWKLNEECKRSNEVFISHYQNKYEEKYLPLWIVAEVMSFGTVLTLYRGLEQILKQTVAREYSIADKVLTSWLIALNGVRNMCAHHARLWNRELGYKPLIPRGRKHPQWQEPVLIPNNRIFGILTILKYMLSYIAPQSKWDIRLIDLLDRYPEIPLTPMGFPANWKNCPIWKVVR